MKKALTLAIVALMLVTLTAPLASAASTTLTTTVPEATYTLNIPVDQTIPFGATLTQIGSLSVTEAAGFAVGKDLKVTMIFDPFKSDSVSSTIPYRLRFRSASGTGDLYISSGDNVIFTGKADGSVAEFAVDKAPLDSIHLSVESADWGKALAGTYTTTITFTAEVVLSET